MFERGFIVSCSNCYTPNSLDNLSPESKCAKCGRVIPVYETALALMHLFCSVALPDQQYAFELLKYLAVLSWGDAMRIGRHDWIIIGCPISFAEFENVILRGTKVDVAAIRRLWSYDDINLFFKQANEGLGRAAVQRLVRGEPDYLTRENLYRIIKLWPSKEGCEVLERLRIEHPDLDGNPATTVGSVLVETDIECQICELPDEERVAKHSELFRQLFLSEHFKRSIRRGLPGNE